jgi:hypothetical protein
MLPRPRVDWSCACPVEPSCAILAARLRANNSGAASPPCPIRRWKHGPRQNSSSRHLSRRARSWVRPRHYHRPRQPACPTSLAWPRPIRSRFWRWTIPDLTYLFRSRGQCACAVELRSPSGRNDRRYRTIAAGSRANRHRACIAGDRGRLRCSHRPGGGHSDNPACLGYARTGWQARSSANRQRDHPLDLPCTIRWHGLRHQARPRRNRHHIATRARSRSRSTVSR